MNKKKKILAGAFLAFGALMIPVGAIAGTLPSTQANAATSAQVNSATQSVSNGKTVVHDHYNIDVSKLYATGYDLDSDAHAQNLVNDMKVTANFQSLLPKITSYEGHNVSQEEVNKTVQSVSFQFDH